MNEPKEVVKFPHGVYDLGDNPTPMDGVFFKAWWVEAPWAHPVWKNYCIMLYDLRPREASTGISEAKLYMPGVTHEVNVVALDPSPLDTTQQDHRRWPPAMMAPANHIYQFTSPDDKAAESRISSMIDLIAGRELSPDTDYTSTWDALFFDGVSLKQK